MPMTFMRKLPPFLVTRVFVKMLRATAHLVCPAMAEASLVHSIEMVDPLSQCMIGYQQCLADKLSVGTGQKHLDGATACSCFIGTHPGSLLELFNGRVSRIGDE